MGPQYYREKIADPKLKAAARAEFGKLGFDIDEVLKNSDSSPRAAKEDRAKMRRALNMFHDEVKAGKIPFKNKDGTDNRNIEDAGSWAAAVINLITEDLDLGEFGEARFGGAGTGANANLRDSDGRKIGKLISNQDLRDPSKIAAQLGVSGSSNEGMSLTEFFRGVANMRTTDGVRNALSEGTNTAGGYLVPGVLLPGILNVLVPASSLLQADANVAVLEDQSNSFNIAATDTIPTAAWRNESAEIAESDPAFRSITITPRSLAFRFKVSRELLADAPGLEQALRIAIAQAFAKELDRAGLRGSGTAPEIRGLLNIGGVHAIGNGTNGATLTNYNKLINAARAIKEADAPTPNTAIMSPREDETMALFADTTGQPLRRPDALTSWNFLTSSQIPTDLTVGTSSNCSEIFVGDFSLFTFFMREGVSVQLLNELHATTGEVGFVCHTRVDIAVAYAKAFAVIAGIKG